MLGVVRQLCQNLEKEKRSLEAQIRDLKEQLEIAKQQVNIKLSFLSEMF